FKALTCVLFLSFLASAGRAAPLLEPAAEEAKAKADAASKTVGESSHVVNIFNQRTKILSTAVTVFIKDQLTQNGKIDKNDEIWVTYDYVEGVVISEAGVLGPWALKWKALRLVKDGDGKAVDRQCTGSASGTVKNIFLLRDDDQN